MSTVGVIGAVSVVVASTEANTLLTHGTLTMRPVIAGFLLGIPLFLIDSANEKMGSKFIFLIIITALILNGGPLFKLLTAAPLAAKG